MSQGKRVLPVIKIINAGVMTGTTVLSGTQDITNLDNVSILMLWTGSAVGTFKVYGSVDGTTFDDLAPTAVDGTSTLTAAGSGSHHTVALQNAPFKYVKVEYTNASSTGVLDVSVFGKGN